ncbi:NAD(P)-binding domain-containing protein [Paracoccaceae bacterium]|nr:NAD(P)-binding domain-containing protein [Paracoccaceae bacterium]
MISNSFKEDILKEKIGLAGCGNMGLPMLNSMLSKNIDAKGYDIERKTSLLDLGKDFLNSKKNFLNDRNIIISVVRDASDTLELCQGNNGLFEQQSSKMLIIASTLSPKFIMDLKRKAPKNITIIDAPMSGATIAANEATLTFMVGCEKVLFNYIEPLLGLMGTRINHIGNFGSGMMVKVLNNFIAASSVVSVRHVLHQAQKFELDIDALFKTIDTSSGQTWFGTNRADIEWFKENFEKDNTMGILKKDVEAYVDSFENETDLDNFVSGELSASIIKAINNMPVTK